MRNTLIASAALAFLLAGSMGASAQSGSMGQNEKYCSQMGAQTGGGSAPHCAFKTMAQCEATIKGKQGTCIENPKAKKM
jgi:hypothetical protein